MAQKTLDEMHDMTYELIYDKFMEPSFVEAYRAVLKSLNELDFFRNEWFHHGARTEPFFEQCLEKEIAKMLASDEREHVFVGAYVENDPESIRVYSYIPYRVAQKIKAKKKLLLAPLLTPFISVDIWIGSSSLEGMDVFACAETRSGRHIDLPKEMNGFPVEYCLSQSTRRYRGFL